MRRFPWLYASLWALPVMGLIVFSYAIGRADAAPRATPDQTIQVKLRDLLDMVPRKDAAEVLLRLKAIEDRLAAIEGLLRAAPIPLPAPVPVTGTRK